MADTDYVERQAQNALFGDRVATERIADVLAIELGKSDSELINVQPLDLRLYPGETMTFSAESASATEAFIGLDWAELF